MNVSGNLPQPLHWFHDFAVHALGDDFRLSHHQLIAFPAHHFQQDGELQFSPPITLKVSGLSVSSTLDGDVGQQLLFEALAQIPRGDVLAVRPANGEVFTVNSIAMVGSSMAICGSGAGFSTLVMVSPMVIPSTPATATMSPSSVSVMSVRFSPVNENSLVILVFSIVPSSLAMATSSPVHRVPLKTRAMASRPR